MSTASTLDEILISSDSHVMEDPDLWVDRLPQRFRARRSALLVGAVAQRLRGPQARWLRPRQTRRGNDRGRRQR